MKKGWLFFAFFVVFGVVSIGIVSAQISLDELTRYYDFESSDEVVNGIYDLLPFEGNPIYTTTDALIGKSGRVTSNNNWKILGSDEINLGAPGDKSLNLWIRPENVEADSMILWRHAGQFGFYIQFLDDKFYFSKVVGGLYHDPQASNNQWYMMTIVKEEGNALIYIDGVLQTEGSSGLTDETDIIYIGVTESGAQDLIGLFDEMSWWGRALNQNEITDLYNNGNGLNLINQGEPPVLEPIGDKFINENETLTIQLTADDPDNDTLIFYTDAGEVIPSPYSFDAQTGLFEWTPTFNGAGDYFVTFGVTDGFNIDEETIFISVTDVDPNTCKWDFDGDGIVGFADLLSLIAHWGSCTESSSATYIPPEAEDELNTYIENEVLPEIDRIKSKYTKDKPGIKLSPNNNLVAPYVVGAGILAVIVYLWKTK